MNKTKLISTVIIALMITSCSIKKKTILVEPKRTESSELQVLKLWTKQSLISEVMDFEKSLDEEKKILRKKVFLSESVFPLIDKYEIDQPFIVNRSLNSNLPIYAEYFYSKNDSILRYVSYDWEKDRYGNTFKKAEMWKEESKKIEFYNTKYEEIKSNLQLDFGEPETQDSIPMVTKSQYGQKDYLSRNTVWESEEIFAKLNMIFADNTYRIRLNFYWKEK